MKDLHMAGLLGTLLMMRDGIRSSVEEYARHVSPIPNSDPERVARVKAQAEERRQRRQEKQKCATS